MWTGWRLWVASVFRPRERARDIDAELTFHLQARIEHLRRDGVPDARGLVSSFLYGIEPTDVATLGISMAILVYGDTRCCCRYRVVTGVVSRGDRPREDAEGRMTQTQSSLHGALTSTP